MKKKRIKINEVENEHTIKRINKTKMLFEKNNKIDTPLAKVIKKKKKARMTDIGNKKRDIIFGTFSY